MAHREGRAACLGLKPNQSDPGPPDGAVWTLRLTYHFLARTMATKPHMSFDSGQQREQAMPGDKTTIVVVPAYKAAATLKQVVDDIPMDLVDEIIVVDDCSPDDTCQVARELNVTLVRKEQNGGYGATQKTCYDLALERDPDYVIMIHGDYQYDPRLIPAAVTLMDLDVCDVILGNRIRTRREALSGGMPMIKYLANRGLTFIENILSGQNLGEWHSGWRAYRGSVLRELPYHLNSDDFVFDTQFLVQCVNLGFRLGDIPAPVRYFEEASSINLRDSAVYATSTLLTFVRWHMTSLGILKSPLFEQPKE